LALLLLYGAPLAFFVRSLRQPGENQPYAQAGLLLVLSYICFGLTQVLSAHHVGTAFYALTVSVLAGLCITTQRAKQ
jgi:O-antigen ligase